jgi:hypothetical protein
MFRYVGRHPVVRVTLGAAIAVLAAVGSARVHGAVSRQDIPQITLHGASTVRSLSAWPGFTLSVDRDAHVTVFAVTRGRRNFPIQVLSPVRPEDHGRLKANQRVRVRNLENRELLHLVNYGEAPVVVGFASSIKPDLSQFVDGKRWGSDLLMDTLAVDQQDMVDILGKTIFGGDAEYDVVISAAADPMPVTRRFGVDGLGFFRAFDDIDPLVRGAFGAGVFNTMPFGVPLLLPNGGRFSFNAPIPLRDGLCTGYRVA